VKRPWCKSEDQPGRTEPTSGFLLHLALVSLSLPGVWQRSWHLEPFNNRGWVCLGTVTVIAGLFLAVLWLATNPRCASVLAERRHARFGSTAPQHLASRGDAGDASTGVTREPPADAGISADNALRLPQTPLKRGRD
jgi:hypothetical protein